MYLLRSVISIHLSFGPIVMSKTSLSSTAMAAATVTTTCFYHMAYIYDAVFGLCILLRPMQNYS